MKGGCFKCRKACTKRPGHSSEYSDNLGKYWCLHWEKYVPRDYGCEQYEEHR